jgi:serine phosphatase RsbU (regulator of sigma subunit)
MGAVALTALLVPGERGLLPLLSLGPAFAAVAGGLRYTLFTGGVAVTVCALLAAYASMLTSRQDILALATVAGVTVTGAFASAERRRRERELANVTAIAEAAQRVLLRPVPPQVGGCRLAVQYISAASGARIGGDLYEVLAVDGVMRLIVGDVQGKGLPAVQTAATVLGAFRETAYDAPGLIMIADRIETSLARRADGEQFVTAVLAEVSEDGSKIELLNCGHPPPMLVSEGAGQFVQASEAGLPLGLCGLATLPRETVTVGVGPGDSILFYTDGISEARDKSGTFFPLSGSLPGDGRSAEEMLTILIDAVMGHVGHALDDDAALLVLHRDPDLPQNQARPLDPSRGQDRPPGSHELEPARRRGPRPGGPAHPG